MTIYNIDKDTRYVNSQKLWIEIEEKDKLSDFLWKEKDLKIKLRLSSLNLIANYKMNVKNVSSRSKEVKEKVEECGIYPVFLPPYSPDLNPIELFLKSIKRVISLKFIENTEELKCLIRDNFMVFSQNLSYAKNWMLELKTNLSPI